MSSPLSRDIGVINHDLKQNNVYKCVIFLHTSLVRNVSNAIYIRLQFEVPRRKVFAKNLHFNLCLL